MINDQMTIQNYPNLIFIYLWLVQLTKKIYLVLKSIKKNGYMVQIFKMFIKVH